MASPPPNPKEGEESSEFSEEPRERPPAPQKTLIAPPASQLPTKLQYVTLGASGPSGIKQLFRSVKVARRVPTLPRRPPRDEPSTAPGAAPGPSAPPAAAPAPGPAPRPAVPRRRDHTKRHICETCEKRFSSPGKLSQHVLSHTGELPFSCDLCDKRFNSKFKLGRHNLIHTMARAFVCHVCGKSFNRKDHLTNHVRVHNPLKMLYTCERPNCRKSYTSLLSYRKHAALHSAEEGDLTCKICEKTFTNKKDIIYHLKVHTGSRTVKDDSDKKFTCSYCGRKFFTAKDVRRHQVVHTGSRDFLCPYCPQKFGRKDHLVRHVKNAHPDESWKSAAVGTSSEPPPEALAFEETYTEYSTEFPESSELPIWNPQSPEEGTSKGRTRVPSSDIIVEIPPDLDIKMEPLDDQINIEMEEPRSPSCSLIQGMEYPMMYVVAPPYSQTPSTLPFMTEELPEPLETHLIDASNVETLLIDPGEGPSGLSSQMLRGLLEDSETTYTGEEGREGRVQQRLPAFTQAFQTAQSPKPPPPPPPPH